MGRVNAYLPDDLAERGKAAGLNFSQLLREAVADALEAGAAPEPQEHVEVLSARRAGEIVTVRLRVPRSP